MRSLTKPILSFCALLSLATSLSACIIAPEEGRPYRDREVVVEHPRPHMCDRRDCW